MTASKLTRVCCNPDCENAGVAMEMTAFKRLRTGGYTTICKRCIRDKRFRTIREKRMKKQDKRNHKAVFYLCSWLVEHGYTAEDAEYAAKVLKATQ